MVLGKFNLSVDTCKWLTCSFMFFEAVLWYLLAITLLYQVFTHEYNLVIYSCKCGSFTSSTFTNEWCPVESFQDKMMLSPVCDLTNAHKCYLKPTTTTFQSHLSLNQLSEFKSSILDHSRPGPSIHTQIHEMLWCHCNKEDIKCFRVVPYYHTSRRCKVSPFSRCFNRK